MDVDAITAESAELFKAGGADAASTTGAPKPSASPKLGLGLPTSPLRSPSDIIDMPYFNIYNTSLPHQKASMPKQRS